MSKLHSFSNFLTGIIDNVEISKIKTGPNLLRQGENNIQELANSIRQKGLLQPILVRTKDGFYEIVAGSRRYEACKTLHYKKITCHIVEINDKEAFELSLIENLQRKTLSSLEEAQAFKTYISDFGWGGMADLAAKIGKSASYITKRIKLLNLPTEVLNSIKEHTITISVAEELCSIKDQETRSELSKLISKRHLSLRKTRRLVKDIDEGYAVFNSSSINGYSNNQHMQRSFDKSIIALRIAMNRIGEILDDERNNWMIYEILLHQRNIIHQQIDSLLKAKRKCKHHPHIEHLSVQTRKSFGDERFCPAILDFE
jgi:ParB family transcriptional regulator, chromosome partitioning protein